jgi:hypothetical protein
LATVFAGAGTDDFPAFVEVVGTGAGSAGFAAGAFVGVDVPFAVGAGDGVAEERPGGPGGPGGAGGSGGAVARDDADDDVPGDGAPEGDVVDVVLDGAGAAGALAMDDGSGALEALAFGATRAAAASAASAPVATVRAASVVSDASAAIPDSAARALTLDVRRRYIAP